MENKQAIANIKQGKNIPYKHETITTLVNMANKLEKIEQIIDDCDSGMISCEQLFLDLRTILERE